MTRRLPFLLLLAVAAVIAVATVVEHLYGTQEALSHIYGSWWFMLLWAFVVCAGGWLMWKKRMWKRPHLLALHLSFVVILTGALVTHFTSHRGFVHLREGEATRHYIVREGLLLKERAMPFFLALDSFRVEFDADGQTHSDYVSHVLVADEEGELRTTVSMNKIVRTHGYRIYQTSYDDDWAGTVLTVNYDPWGTGITYLGYALLAVSMIWCGRKQTLSSGLTGEGTSSRWSTILLTICGFLLASYMVISIAFRPLMPVLRSPLLFVHVGTIMVAYILLVVSLLRREVLRTAVFFLSAGIFLGAVWANISWGTYWSWDPKEAWALITLIVYSIPLHTESLPWFKNTRNYRIFSLLALVVLLMTYFGVNYLLGGMHSYANG